MATKYGRPRAEVDAEINARLEGSEEMQEAAAGKSNFLDGWMGKKATVGVDKVPLSQVESLVGVPEEAKTPVDAVSDLNAALGLSGKPQEPAQPTPAPKPVPEPAPKPAPVSESAAQPTVQTDEQEVIFKVR